MTTADQYRETFAAGPHNPYELAPVLAAHEAGHCVVTGHFTGEHCTTELTYDGEGNIGAATNTTLAVGGTPFQRACCGWAGLLAEHVLGKVMVPGVAPESLTFTAVRTFCGEVWSGAFQEVLTGPDREWAGGDLDAAGYAFLVLMDKDYSNVLLREKFEELSKQYSQELHDYTVDRLLSKGA